MNRSAMLRSAGGAGLALGVLMMAGSGALGELAALARGYGLLMAGAAVYLLAGLGVRALYRRAPRKATSESARAIGQS